MTGLHRIALLLGAALAALLLFVPPVEAQRRRGRIRVRVVDVSAGRAFVEPGEEGGLRRGATVVIRRRRFRVIGTTSAYGAIELGNRRLAVGARGVATIRGGGDEEEGPTRLETPQPLAAFRGQWPEADLPATDQHPAHVPIGVVQEGGPLELALSAGVVGLIPLGDDGQTLGRGQLRARVHAEPFRELPLALDADAAIQYWIASNIESRPGHDSQPYLRVRALSAALGDPDDLFAAMGRLRYAARTLGQLDGVRVQSPSLGGLTVGAFGGFVPDPLEGKPVLDASRFGLEIAYRATESPLRPMLTVVGHGSIFDGQMDERRVATSVELFPGRSRVGAHAELSFYDEGNPWGAKTTEITAAGVDGTLRLGAFRAGARLDARRPERSLWLASYLPETFLCPPRPQPDPSGPEPCDRRFDTRYQADLDLGIEAGSVAVSGGATAVRVGHRGDLDQVGGRLGVRALLSPFRAELSTVASTGGLLQTFAVRLGAGWAVLRDLLDVRVHYRPALTRYEADTDFFLAHTVGGGVLWTPRADLDLTLGVDGMASDRDISMLIVQAGATWRPDLLDP